MESTLNGPFKEVVGLGSLNIFTIVLYGRSLGTKYNDYYRGVVDLWR